MAYQSHPFMSAHPLKPVLLLLLLTLMVTVYSCDQQITQPTSEPEPTPEKTLDIPATGPTALPGWPDSTKSSSNANGKHTKLPAKYILQAYARQHPSNPFVAISGVWDSTRSQYHYRAIPLEFSKDILKAAEGEKRYYIYFLKYQKKARVYRMLAAFIPDHPKAKKRMNRWLKVKNQALVKPYHPPESSDNKRFKTGKSCYKHFPWGWSATVCDGGPVVMEIFGHGSGGGSGGIGFGGGSGGWPISPPSGPPNMPMPPSGGGGGGGTTDNGDGKTTKEKVKNYLEDHEFALLDVPCGQIDEWQNIAQHKVPDDVMNRMDNVLSNYKVQKLENAEGAIVNMDYFAVTMPINSIPVNWSPKHYLNVIRQHMNRYLEGSVFEYYPGLPNEKKRWFSDKPLGTLFSIQLTGKRTWLDDGTVVTSGYDPKTNAWTFTTLYTDNVDDWHPVSGNRKFGYTKNGDGTVTFYTQGVDRLSNNWYEAIQNISGKPYNEADELWKSFQRLVAEGIEQAVIEKPITWRPNYSKVEAVLNGQARVSSLGCN